MSDVTIGNTSLSQNHPRIITLVSNQTETYQSNASGLTAFGAVISERGSEDIVKVNSAAEFLKLYGAMDIRQFGQSSYNILNWLSSGGTALIKRIMPDDAAFAHAFINVRTKTAGDRVEIQPLISSIGEATTEDTLDFVLTNGGEEANYEGYKDNIIASVKPIGRGEAYHNIGFRLYPNRQYDNYVNFRLYNFEVIEFTDQGSYNILEGPFAVSFVRDAISPINNESIFIEDVLAAYSEFLEVKVNDDNFARVCKLICPKASNPFIVDPFFAETRTIAGAVETVDGKDVHFNLFKLDRENPVVDSNGEVIKFKADPDSEFEVGKIEIEDRAARAKFLYDYEHKIEDMAEFLGMIKAGSGEITLAQDMDATITASEDHDVLLGKCRKLLSRGIVVGEAKAAALELELEAFEKALLEYEISLERQKTGTEVLNNFYDSLVSDMKLITSSHTLTKIAWIQDRITTLSRELSKLDLVEVAGLEELENIVVELSDEYTTLNAKSVKVEALLVQDPLVTTSLLYKVNTLINGVKSKLTEAVMTAPNAAKGPEESAGIVGAYQDLGECKAKKDNFDLYEMEYKNQKQNIVTDRIMFNELADLTVPVRLRDGSEGEFHIDNPERNAAINRYLCQLFEGTLDELIVSSELCQFNFILDGAYDLNVKNAIADLAQNIRRDFVYIADCGLNANAKGDLAFRKQFNVASNFIAIYGQNEIIYDSHGGKDVKVTTPYLLAEKIPVLEATVGLQNPIAGSKRGVLSGFKSINYLPTEVEKEDLYNARVNYVEGDGMTYRLGSQLTSDLKRTPLSDLNNVITMLNIKRDAQSIVKAYQFEFNDDDVMRSMQQDLNLNLNKYVTNKCVDTLECTVYASEYDLSQHICRVDIAIKFKSIIETIIVTLEVTA